MKSIGQNLNKIISEKNQSVRAKPTSWINLSSRPQSVRLFLAKRTLEKANRTVHRTNPPVHKVNRTLHKTNCAVHKMNRTVHKVNCTVKKANRTQSCNWCKITFQGLYDCIICAYKTIFRIPSKMTARKYYGCRGQSMTVYETYRLVCMRSLVTEQLGGKIMW